VVARGCAIVKKPEQLVGSEVPPKERLASTDALVLWPSDGGNH
jgi:hypothetical protein